MTEACNTLARLPFTAWAPAMPAQRPYPRADLPALRTLPQRLPARTATAPGQITRVNVETLKPTQMTVGMRSVVRKRMKFESRASSRKRMEKTLAARPIPAVQGPANELFLIDNHHFGLALWQAQVKEAYVRIVDDKSHLAPHEFWRAMEAEGCLHPFDEHGARIPPELLPFCLQAMRHDPYRDLAWEVREAGGYRKMPIPYAEFRWAGYFRRHLPLARVLKDHQGAVQSALALCHRPEARHLPGYVNAPAA